MDTNYSASHVGRGILQLNYQWVIRDEDLTAAAATETIDLLGDMVSGDVAGDFLVRVDTNFDGGATTTMLMDVGFSLDAAASHDDPDYFIQQYDVHEDTTITYVYGGKSSSYQWREAGDIEALFTASGANVSVLTAGQVSIFGNVIRANEYPQTQAT
jgi:hypothetical protein